MFSPLASHHMHHEKKCTLRVEGLYSAKLCGTFVQRRISPRELVRGQDEETALSLGIANVRVVINHPLTDILCRLWWSSMASGEMAIKLERTAGVVLLGRWRIFFLLFCDMPLQGEIFLVWVRNKNMAQSSVKTKFGSGEVFYIAFTLEFAIFRTEMK